MGYAKALLTSFLAITSGLVFVVECQENSGNNVAPSLLECYNQTELLDRDRRPPSTINILIDLIRKIEDGPTTFDARQMAINLIHRFRQDGILRAEKVSSTSGVLPYKPNGFQQAKHSLLLKKLLPGNANNFPNETLSAVERCSMHFMMSNSIDDTQRGDEDHVCSQLSRYQMRVRRHAFDNNPKRDAEYFSPQRQQEMKGNVIEGLPDVEIDPNTEIDMNNKGPVPAGRGIITTYRSDCPVENGVIYTRWGPVAAGNMLAGIAAGLEQQQVPGVSITIDQKQTVLPIDNRFAATLGGDLAESALHQGPILDKVNVGCSGGWNSTLVPRWYFIETSNDNDWYLTDAEIRGGLDGLIMAMNVKDWVGKASNLKVSQILDMYYSARGVFSRDFRACRRRELLMEYAPTEKLIQETTAFSVLLDKQANLQVSIVDGEAFQQYSGMAVDETAKYIARELNDLTCAVQDEEVTAACNMTIILDTQWPYSTIQPALSHLLNNVDIHKFGSYVTIINARDGQVMLNSTNSITDFHVLLNQTTYQLHPTGFDASKTLNNIEIITKQILQNESTQSRISEKSSLFLIIPYSSGISSAESSFAVERIQHFKQHLPDINILVAAKNMDAFRDLVVDSTKDLFTLRDTSDSTSLFSDLAPLIARTKEIPRRIANPKCGPDWTGETEQSHTIDQFVEPDSVNFYRIYPNYFFGEGEARVKIRGQGITTGLTVCQARQTTLPRSSNSTSSNNNADVKCQAINTNEYVITLTNGCDGYDRITDCPPLYFSVESKQDAGNMAFQCTDAGCRFPSSVKYSITTEGLRCENGAFSLLSSLALIVSMLFLLKL